MRGPFSSHAEPFLPVRDVACTRTDAGFALLRFVRAQIAAIAATRRAWWCRPSNSSATRRWRFPGDALRRTQRRNVWKTVKIVARISIRRRPGQSRSARRSPPPQGNFVRTYSMRSCCLPPAPCCGRRLPWSCWRSAAARSRGRLGRVGSYAAPTPGAIPGRRGDLFSTVTVARALLVAAFSIGRSACAPALPP